MVLVNQRASTPFDVKAKRIAAAAHGREFALRAGKEKPANSITRLGLLPSSRKAATDATTNPNMRIDTRSKNEIPALKVARTYHLRLSLDDMKSRLALTDFSICLV
jgi:hypothetical protein